LNGGRMDDVVALAAKEKWEVSDRTLRDYMNQADAKPRAECSRGFRKLIRDHRAKRLHLYKIAMEQKQIQTAITILDSDAKPLENLLASLPESIAPELRTAITDTLPTTATLA